MTVKKSDLCCLLDVAYILFAEEGSRSLTIRNLSRLSGLPYGKCLVLFPTRQQLMTTLLARHREEIVNLCKMLSKHASFVPDFFRWISNNPSILRFHRQLLLYKTDPQINQVYHEMHSQIISAAFALWARQVNFTGDFRKGRDLFYAIMNLWLLHLDPHDLSLEVLINNMNRIHQRLFWLRKGWEDGENGVDQSS